MRMSLNDEVKKCESESHKKWFDRFFDDLKTEWMMMSLHDETKNFKLHKNLLTKVKVFFHFDFCFLCMTKKLIKINKIS